MQGSQEGKSAKLWGPRAHFGANISLERVTLIEASYSEDEVTTGSVNPRPPMRTGRPRRSRSTLVTVWSVTAEWLK